MMRGNKNNNDSSDHLLITHHVPSIFLLMLPYAVSIKRKWGTERGSNSPRVAQLVRGGSAFSPGRPLQSTGSQRPLVT